MKADQPDADARNEARSLPSATGSHRRTLEAIFRHPTAHNLEWRQLTGLIAEIGDAHEKGNGEFVFEVAGARHIMRKPHDKDLTSSEVIEIRHFLTQTGYSEDPPAQPAWRCRISEKWPRFLNREIDRLVDAITKGLGDPAVLGPGSTVLDGARKTVAAELVGATPAAEAVALHPAMLARHEEQLSRYSVVLADGISDGDTECSKAIRDLVETVTVFRDGARPGGVRAKIAGRLTAVLGEQAFPNRLMSVG